MYIIYISVGCFDNMHIMQWKDGIISYLDPAKHPKYTLYNISYKMWAQYINSGVEIDYNKCNKYTVIGKWKNNTLNIFYEGDYENLESKNIFNRKRSVDFPLNILLNYKNYKIYINDANKKY